MRVLLVEDEERLAHLVAEGLTGQGFDVDVEHDGDVGLWRAREGSYDVLVLDVMLPGRSGTDVCATLRAEERWTPVLVLTAKDRPRDEVAALDCGADDYLRKPFSFVVLVARLRALARRGAVARPAVLSCGDLRLDPAAHTVARGGTEISLTVREFAVLELLLRHRGDPVPKRRILDHVWGLDADPTSNVVEVYVRYLRQKVDEPFGRSSIRTVRGAGYRVADTP